MIKSKDSIFDGKVADIELGATQKVGEKKFIYDTHSKIASKIEYGAMCMHTSS